MTRSAALLRRALRCSPPLTAEAPCARASPSPFENCKHQFTTTADAASVSQNEKQKGRWFTLPPFNSTVDGAALGKKLSGCGSDTVEGTTTALKWVLRCCPQLPRSLVQKLFRIRQVRRESPGLATDFDKLHERHQCKRVAAKDVMNLGDRIFLPVSIQQFPSKEPDGSHNKEEIEFIRSLELYKDPAIIVVNKPIGMPVQGGAGIRNSFDELAATYLRYDCSEPPRLVHRIDRDSSGILVMGRTHISTTVLHSIFREKTFGAPNDDLYSRKRILQKRYWALVIGSPRRAEGLISAPLKKVIVDNGKSERIIVAENGQMGLSQHAITKYRVIKSCSQGYTWMELSPLTGRKHQLRVHCSEVLGTPIVGDYKYGWQAHKKMKHMPFSNFQTDLSEESLKKRSLPFGLEIGDRSILEKQPCLHLHCKEMVLPDVHKALQQVQLSSECDLDELDSLKLAAPLPSHMQKSWKVLCS